MVGGLIWGAHMMHVPSDWIAVATVVLLDIGILRLSRHKFSLLSA
jgi:hypothetical protein